MASILRLGLCLVVISVGCATVRIPGASRTLLAFLQPGSTTRQEVIVNLGQPSGAFERETIFTYRVGEDNQQGYYIVSPRALLQWQETHYSLVLVFNENGILQKKSLVEVR